MRRFPKRKVAGFSLVLLLAVPHAAVAQSSTAEGQKAFGDWRADKPGVVRRITAADLPNPGATASASNASRVVTRPASATPQVPAGFKAELFAGGLDYPRVLRIA